MIQHTLRSSKSLDTWYLTLHTCHLTFDIWHFPFVICHLSFVFCYLTFFICLLFVIHHLIFDMRHLTFDIWHMTFDIWHDTLEWYWTILFIFTDGFWCYLCNQKRQLDSLVMHPGFSGYVSEKKWWNSIHLCGLRDASASKNQQIANTIYDHT